MKQFENISFKRRLLLWMNHLHFHASLQKSGKFYKFVIHEKYKTIVKALKVILTLIGLFSAYITFQSVHIAFLFALIIFLLTGFLEKIVFSYTSVFIPPMPDFELCPEKWMSAFFGFAEDPKGDFQIPLVGWIFSEEEYARRIHALLLTWSCDKLNDENKNVSLSVILEEKKEGDGYIFFCYPAIERENAKKFHESIEQERRQKSLSDVHNKYFMMLMLGKKFKITKDSYLPTFKERYKVGIPFLFRIMVIDKKMQPKQIDGLEDFVFYNLNIKDKSELTRKDIEYDLFRIVFPE